MKRKLTFTVFWDTYSTGSILLLMLIVFSALSPSAFLSIANLIKIVEQSSITILLACGEFFSILLAGIDLSVGSVMAFTGVVTARLLVFGMQGFLAVFIGIFITGAIIGAINGSLINITRLPPFIVTLGTSAIIRGLTMVVTNARSIPNLPISFVKTTSGTLFGFVPMPIIIALITALVLVFFTQKTQAGRNLYAIGGNSLSAWFSGINVYVHTVLAFTISGVCAAVAGMVNIARLSAAEPTAGTGYETFAIAAVIIGGTSFFGGQGVIPKVVVGGLIIGTINNGLNMVGLSSYYQQIAMGCLIITAVTLDRFFGVHNKVR